MAGGGVRTQRKKALTLLMETVACNDYEAHQRVLKIWFGVLGDRDHPMWLGALKEYNRYILGIPVQQHEMEVTSQLTTHITPAMLAAAGIVTAQVEHVGEDGELHTKTVIAGVEPEEADGDGD